MWIIIVIFIVLFLAFLATAGEEDGQYYGTPATKEPPKVPAPPPQNWGKEKKKTTFGPRPPTETIQTQSETKQEAVPAIKDEDYP